MLPMPCARLSPLPQSTDHYDGLKGGAFGIIMYSMHPLMYAMFVNVLAEGHTSI